MATLMKSEWSGANIEVGTVVDPEKFVVQSTEVVHPANGLSFSGSEQSSLIGGHFTHVPVSRDIILAVDEDGIAKGLPQNFEAFKLYGEVPCFKWQRAILGNVLVMSRSEAGYDNENRPRQIATPQSGEVEPK